MVISSTSNVYRKYRVIARIGEGGFSEVYKVQPLDAPKNSNIVYALKYCVVKNDNDAEINRKRFKQEIEVYKKIRSQRIAAYIDSYMDNREQYLVMEYVDGTNLRDLLKKNGKFIPKTAVYYTKQIAEGIAELHNCNIIHRDIKSNNIMVTKDRNVKIIDFGLALGEDSQRLTQASKVVGSVYYMAPELCVTNAQPSVRSDIYALGILLFELLTGTYPIKGREAHETLKMQRTHTVPNIMNMIEAPQALANVITKATAKDPMKRYASMWEMRNDLNTCLDTKRIYEKPLDIRKVKPKKTAHDILNSKKFLIPMITIILLIFVIGITLIAVYVH